MVATARATMTAGRIKKSIQELEGFDWDAVAALVDEALADDRRADAEITCEILNQQTAALRALNAELALNLKHVCMIAERLGPKAHNTHREEAQALLDGTVKEAREVLAKIDKS